MSPLVLTLAGLWNSGPQHWQTHWEARHPQWSRVPHGEWQTPDKDTWVAELDRAIAACARPPVLAAHSLACVLVAHWAASGSPHKIAGAFLVAPSDVEAPSYPAGTTGFAPMPLQALPFPTLVVASGSLDGDHRFSRFNPAIGLAYAPAAGVSAYLGYNEGSRTPTAIELGCADPENPCRLPNAMAGDPPLKQVVTKTWEAGVRGPWGEVARWSAGLFRAENHDDILFVADNQAGFGYFKNFGKTRHQGVELALDGKAGALDFGVNYTWLQATYQSRELVNGSANSSSDAQAPGLEGNIVITPGNRIPLMPSHIFKAHVDVQGGRDWTVGLAMTAVSSSHARGNENNRHQAGGPSYLGSGKSGGYAVVELNGKVQLTPRLSMFAQVSNLFDRKYATAAQLGATGFDASGNFAARPLPAVNGEYPMVNATFYAAGAPRSVNAGLRYAF